MFRKITFLVAPILLLLWVPGYAQDPSQDQPQPSLGDIARAARKDKEKNVTKAKTVITDDNLPSSNGLNGLADVGNSQASGDAMAKATARLEEAETGMKKLATLDRATLAKVVLLDNDVDFPNRRAWEDKLFAAKEHYVSHEGELIVELRQIMAQVQSWKASHGEQSKLDPADPQGQQLKQRLMEIIQDALRTEQAYRAAVMEGWDLAKQAKH
jgi:hypothetical protein